MDKDSRERPDFRRRDDPLGAVKQRIWDAVRGRGVPVAGHAIAGSESREQTSVNLRDCTDDEAGLGAAALPFCTEAPEPFGWF